MSKVDCPSCTFLNPSNSVRCGVCDGPLNSALQAGRWSCTQCTFLNSTPSLRHCAMCAAPRDVESTAAEMSINQSANQSDGEFEDDWGDMVEHDGLSEEGFGDAGEQSISDDEDEEEEEIQQSNNQSSSQSTEVQLTDALLQQMYDLFAEAAKMYHKSITPATNQSSKSPANPSKRVKQMIDEIYLSLNIEAQMNELASKNKPPTQRTAYRAPSECQVCYTEFKETTAVVVPVCAHSTSCVDCFDRYVDNLIDQGDVLPWIKCAEPDCKQVIPPSFLYPSTKQSNEQLINRSIKFVYTYLFKFLSRSAAFVQCKTMNQSTNQSTSQSSKHASNQSKRCPFAFLQLKSAKEKMTCSICKVSQEVERGMDGELDPEFKKWIAEGKMRPCPKCEFLTLKEKGVCNVIQCVKCGIHWNWQTKETGRDANELKQRARMNGTLWMPGELEYQLRLERDNPAEFKALLERNGQKYDPNYRRGGR